MKIIKLILMKLLAFVITIGFGTWAFVVMALMAIKNLLFEWSIEGSKFWMDYASATGHMVRTAKTNENAEKVANAILDEMYESNEDSEDS